MRLSLTIIAFLICFPALAQPRTVEQIVAAEIGQCIMQRSIFSAQIEGLREKIAELEKKLSEIKPEAK